MQRYLSSRLTAGFSAVALSIGLALSCTPSDGDSSGGAGTGGGSGTTGTAGTTGAAGSNGAAGTTGTGGTTGAAGSNGAAGTGSAGTGAAGTGAAGTGVVAAPACAANAGTTDADLANVLNIKATDLTVRRIIATPPSDGLMKIEYDAKTQSIVAMSKGGLFWKIDPVAKTATAIDGNYPAKGGDHRGLAFAKDGTMYTLTSGNNGGNAVTIRKGVGAPGARTWTTIAQSAGYPLPQRGNNFGHSFAGLTLSPDETSIFFSSGSRTDHGEDEEGQREVPLTSAIFKVPTSPTGTTMLPNDENMLKTNGYLYADGTRNTFDMAFNADGDLIGAENGPDIDLPDEVNWLQQGKHYGFPWRFGSEDNPVRDPAYTPAGDMRLHTGLQAVNIGSYTYDVGFQMVPQGVVFVDPIKNLGPDANGYRVGKAGAPTKGDATTGIRGITGHRSPLGLAFDTKGALCGDYYKAGVMLSYGAVQAVFGATDKGEDLVLLTMKKVGDEYQMNVKQLILGIPAPMDSVLVGNKLYTISLGAQTNHSIFEVTFPLPK